LETKKFEELEEDCEILFEKSKNGKLFNFDLLLRPYKNKESDIFEFSISPDLEPRYQFQPE